MFAHTHPHRRSISLGTAVALAALMLLGTVGSAHAATKPHSPPHLTKQAQRMLSRIQAHRGKKGKPLARSSAGLDGQGFVFGDTRCTLGFNIEAADGRQYGRYVYFTGGEPFIRSRNGGQQMISAQWGLQQSSAPPRIDHDIPFSREYYALTDNAGTLRKLNNTGTARIEWTDGYNGFLEDYALNWKVTTPQGQFYRPTLRVSWWNNNGTLQGYLIMAPPVDGITNRWCYLGHEGARD